LNDTAKVQRNFVESYSLESSGAEVLFILVAVVSGMKEYQREVT